MKTNQIKELRSKNSQELEKLLTIQKEDLTRIFIDLKNKKLRNTALVTNKKKMIAVILTIIAQKEIKKV